MLDLYNVLTKRFYRYIFIVLLLSCPLELLMAQSFAMRGGYHIGFTDSKAMNTIVDRYNDTRNWLDNPMPKVRFLDGFHMGLQFTYKFSFELMWAGRYRKISATGVPSGQQGTITRVLDLQYHGISLGIVPLQLKKIPIGFGLSLDFNTLNISSQHSGEPKEHLVQKFNFASTVFMTIQLSILEQLSIDIRPYVQVPVGKVDISSIDEKLNAKNNSTNASKLFRANFLNAGGSISIVYTFWKASKQQKVTRSKPLVDRIPKSQFTNDLMSLLRANFMDLVIEGAKQPLQQLSGALDAQLNTKKQQVIYTYARKFSLEDAKKNYASVVRRVFQALKKGSYQVDEQLLSQGEYQSTTFYLYPNPQIRASTISIMYTCSTNKKYADVDLVILYP